MSLTLCTRVIIDAQQPRTRKALTACIAGRILVSGEKNHTGGTMDRFKLSAFAALAGAVLVSGCATLTKSSDQTVTINTRPPGAECTLERDGAILAVVNPTPGAITVQKDKDPIFVTCRKAGFNDNAGQLASKFESMTFGNIIFGGLIGVGVDAASGAMHEYPPLVTITLIPTQFATTGERDRFFDGLQADLQRETEQVRERIRKQCQESGCDRRMRVYDQVMQPCEGGTCEEQLKEADEAARMQSDKIEAQRAAALVLAPAPAPESLLPTPVEGVR